ncbi:MAG: Glycine dehydrogenase [decarboxylating] (glycine cleavage system P protein), partial [uncultured Nocardioidaceae bacterium]
DPSAHPVGPRDRRPLRRPPHRAEPGRAGQDAGAARRREPRGARELRGPGGHPRDRAAAARRRAFRAGGARRAARPGRPEPRDGADDRPGLLRHPHPAGGPAQRHGEPGLVHRLHAVPARDQPGPARGAAELPDGHHRPHRAGRRWRVPARRGHRRGRGDDAGPPQQQGAGGRRVPRRCRL